MTYNVFLWDVKPCLNLTFLSNALSLSQHADSEAVTESATCCRRTYLFYRFIRSLLLELKMD